MGDEIGGGVELMAGCGWGDSRMVLSHSSFLHFYLLVSHVLSLFSVSRA